MLHGFNGADLISGGGGADRIYGDSGNDNIGGDAGADRLYGGRGSDAVFGGRGNDLLYGNSGADSFFFDRGDGTDRVKDYDDRFDSIVIDTGASRYSQLSVRQSGDDTIVRFSDVTIILEDTSRREIGSSDFVFI